MQQSKLTLQVLSAYLPYNIQAHILDWKSDYVGNEFDRIIGVRQWHKDGVTWCAETDGGAKPAFDRIKLLLRPLSDLTTEIEHNGERFVPIEWFEIGDDENKSPEYDCGNIKLIDLLESMAKHNFCQSDFLPHGVVQKLLEWNFDIFGLLDSGDALPLTAPPSVTGDEG